MLDSIKMVILIELIYTVSRMQELSVLLCLTIQGMVQLKLLLKNYPFKLFHHQQQISNHDHTLSIPKIESILFINTSPSMSVDIF